MADIVVPERLARALRKLLVVGGQSRRKFEGDSALKLEQSGRKLRPVVSKGGSFRDENRNRASVVRHLVRLAVGLLVFGVAVKAKKPRNEPFILGRVGAGERMEFGDGAGIFNLRGAKDVVLERVESWDFGGIKCKVFGLRVVV